MIGNRFPFPSMPDTLTRPPQYRVEIHQRRGRATVVDFHLRAPALAYAKASARPVRSGLRPAPREVTVSERIGRDERWKLLFRCHFADETLGVLIDVA